MKKLETQHSTKTFIIKGLNRYLTVYTSSCFICNLTHQVVISSL